MKKTVSLLLAALLVGQCVIAQLAEGIKNLNYEKNNTAREILKKAYDANPKDPQTIYWYGQSLIARNIEEARAVYQKGLQEIGSDAWLLVGIAHLDLLSGGDINAAKQKFEQAITATTETKGKNKGKPNAAILDAIGRANAAGDSKIGDPVYAIDKLKQAAAIDLTTSDIYINMGINYQKMGGENGGDAVKAYTEAFNRDPKSPVAKFKIGNIYKSQNNKDLLEQYYNEAITIDPSFPPVYLALYNYYSDKDVNKAKDNLDKYVNTADKDPKNEYFLADYLFRAGRYNESIAKAKDLEASTGFTALPRLSILYAYNYDRLGDSLKAKSYLEKFFTSAPMSEVQPTDYELAVKVFSKVPGSEAAAVGYLEKAIAGDTSKVNRIGYMGQAAELFAKAKMYGDELKWLQKQQELKGSAMGEFEYYKFTSTAINAKDYSLAIDLAKKYLAAFPDKPQPYVFLKRAALSSDPDTSKGSALESLDYLDSFYSKDKEKNKRQIFLNLYYRLQYFVNKAKDLDKALEVTGKMLLLYPEPGEENKYATDTRNTISDALNKSKQPAKPGGKPTSNAGTATVTNRNSAGSPK
jgi:hypothetical protein